MGAHRIYDSHKSELEYISKKLHDKYPKSRFFEKGMLDFLYDEIVWMKEHMMKDLSEYEENPRKGRGSVRVLRMIEALFLKPMRTIMTLWRTRAS